MNGEFPIVTLMQNGDISVLLAEQSVRVALEIADQAFVLENGSIVH